MFGSLGATELVIILVIAIIIFGPKRLPQLGRSAGEMVGQLRGVQKAMHEDLTDEDRT